MKSVTTTEFYRNFGTYSDAAMHEPVSITNHGRDSLVVLSADEYKRLKTMDSRRAYYAHELPDDLLDALDDEIGKLSNVESANIPETKF